TVDGEARFPLTALQGTLIEGGGTNDALVEFVDGLVTIEIIDTVPQTVICSGHDTLGQGLRLRPDAFEDFERDDGGFVHSGVDDAWERGVPPSGAHSGSAAWSITTTGHPVTNASLTSRAYALASTKGLVLELYSSIHSFLEYGYIELSNDDGVSWLPVSRTIGAADPGYQF